MNDAYFAELDRVDAEIRACADEIEATGEVPPALLESLCDAGLFQVCTPLSWGGLERSPLDWFRTVVLLARADASVGWLVSQPALYNASVAVAGPEALRPMLLDRRFIIAASVAGSVLGRQVDGGYEIDGGRWAFESGCTNAGVIGGMIAVDGPADAMPELRLVFVPAGDCTIERTWSALGLQGTASHDVTIAPRVVTADWSTPFPWRPTADAPIARMLHGLWPAACSCAAVQLGLASEALDVAKQHATTKRRPGDTAVLFEQGVFHSSWARLSGALEAAAAGMEKALESAWDQAVGGHTVTIEQRARMRIAAAHAVQTGASVVRGCTELVGADGVYRRHRLERLFRDAHVLIHHIVVSDRAIEGVSMSLHGLDPDAAFV